MSKKSDNEKDGVISLVLGILGLIFCFVPFLGLILGIIAVVYANKQNKEKKTGIATAGMVLGILAIIAGIIISLITLSAGVMLWGSTFIEDETTGNVESTENDNTGTVAGNTGSNNGCPDIIETTNYEFKWGESIEGNENLYLDADFLNEVVFSGEWELSNKPSNNPYLSDSFVCAIGSKAGESINKLYCRPTYMYEPKLRKNTIDDEGNIVDTDYQYIKTFIFDITRKDINNANDLKDLEMESITCSKTSY